jgi:hypothetical protein
MKVRLFCFLTCLYLLIGTREPPWADARVMHEAAVSLVDRHRLDIDLDAPAFFFSFYQGKKYSLYPMGNTLAIIPARLLYKVLERIPHAPATHLAILTSHLASTVAAALACMLFLGLLRRDGVGDRTALIASLALGTMTILVIYARVAYSEALQSCLFIWIVNLVFKLEQAPTRGTAALAGFAAGWLITTKAVNVFAVGVILLYLVWRFWRQRQDLVRVVVCSALAFLPWAILTLVINRLKTGSFFDTGYTKAGGVGVFSGPIYPAIYGYLFSPGKSIFFTSPIIILGVLGAPAYFRRNRIHALFLLAVVASVWVPHLLFPAWYGGWVWGPRYTVPVMAFFLVPAAHWLEEHGKRGLSRARIAVLAGLGTMSALVQAIGCFFFWDFYIRMAIALKPAADENLTYVSTVFVPQLSPIVMHAWLAFHKWVGGGPTLPPGAPFTSVLAASPEVQAHWRGLHFDFWFLHWFTKDGPQLWGAGLLVLLGVGLLWSAAGLRRHLARPRAA